MTKEVTELMTILSISGWILFIELMVNNKKETTNSHQNELFLKIIYKINKVFISGLDGVYV